MSTAVKTVSMVALTAAVGFGIYSFFTGSKETNDDLEPALTEEETVHAMEQILMKLKLTATKMIRAAESIKQQMVAAGAEASDDQIMKHYILPHLSGEFKTLQSVVLDEMDIDEDDLDEANKEYIEKGNKKLLEITSKIRQIYTQFGGELEANEEWDQEVASAGSSSLSSSSGQASSSGIDSANVEAFVAALLTGLAEKMLTSTEGFIVQFKEQYGVPKSQKEMTSFQQGLMVITEGVEKQLLEENQLSQQDFQTLLMQFQNSRQIQEIFMQMQFRNQMLLQQHGFQTQNM